MIWGQAKVLQQYRWGPDELSRPQMQDCVSNHVTRNSVFASKSITAFDQLVAGCWQLVVGLEVLEVESRRWETDVAEIFGEPI